MTIERIWIFIAWHLPKPLVKWCFVRLSVASGQGYYSNQSVPDLTCIDALKRWK